MNESSVSEISDDQLDFASGVSSQEAFYRILTIDNGKTIEGTDATGCFITKGKNQEGELVRTKFAEIFRGVILSAKAQMVHKGEKKKWRTGEFNPLDGDTPVPVFTLSEGKPVKNKNGEIQVDWGKIEDIKKAQSTVQPGGAVDRSYDYFVILYLLFGEGPEKEIVKFKFKGTGRGNYFDYVNGLGEKSLKFYEIVTEFSTYVDPTHKKYTVAFKSVLVDGEIERVKNTDLIREKRIDLYQKDMKQLEKLPVMKAPEALPEVQTAPDNDPGPTEPPKVEEIKIEDLPF